MILRDTSRVQGRGKNQSIHRHR